MAFSTGTFEGGTDLLVKLNTFLTANGWTKLAGETDIVPASPKAARYWRILVLENENTSSDFRELELLEWRTTAGGANVATNGANYEFSNVGSGSGADLVSGTGTVITSDIDDNWWWVRYDFGSPTIIRELMIKCDTDDYAPRNFLVQWSNDDETWMTMEYYSDQLWVDNETKVFTWDAGGGYTPTFHVSATVGRRTGWLRDANEGTTRNQDSEGCDNYWSWQGPGYDANRRVYINAITFSNEAGGTDSIQFDAAIANDLTVDRNRYMDNQDGSCLAARGESPVLMVDSNSGTYWFYANSSRFVIVTKSGLDDYQAAYLGFMASFAQPDDYPFPLYIGATCNSRTQILSDAAADLRDFADPGQDAAFVRLFDNAWAQVNNHGGDLGRINDPIQFPSYYVWPFHSGSSGRETFPNNTIGDYVDWDAHWLDRLEPTDQGDLPLIPLLVISKEHGNLGALDGVFAVPQGGVLSPEQLLTISATNYRVFRVRDKTGGMVYWAILEA